MRTAKFVFLSAAAPLLCCGLVVSSGCRDERRHKSSEDVEYPVVDAPVPADAPPEQVARAILDALKNLQSVRQNGLGRAGNRHKYDLAMATVESLAAKQRIYKLVQQRGSPVVPKDVSEPAALRLVAESWASIVAHYAGGFLFDTLKADVSRTLNRATVRILVENPDEQKRLEQIEALPEIAHAKDKDAHPLLRGSPEYLKLLRSRTLPEGFNVPIRKQLTLVMIQEEGAWRVLGLTLGPAPPHEAPKRQMSSAPAGRRNGV